MGGMKDTALLERQWAEQVDEWIAAGRPEHIVPAPEILRDTNEFFKFDQYDWERFEPEYAAIPLTGGYFTIVDKRDAKRVLRYSWQANVQRHRETGKILKVYAFCNVRKKQGRTRMYLHRFLAKAGTGVVIDHYNGLSLDNRRQNLRATTHAGNGTNRAAAWRRTTYPGLPRGVEVRGKRYGGQIKCRGVVTRSKRVWNIPEPAHQWYLRKHKEVHGHRCITQAKKEYPVFPPRKDVPEDVPF